LPLLFTYSLSLYKLLLSPLGLFLPWDAGVSHSRMKMLLAYHYVATSVGYFFLYLYSRTLRGSFGGMAKKELGATPIFSAKCSPPILSGKFLEKVLPPPTPMWSRID